MSSCVLLIVFCVFLLFVGLINRFIWMQELYPLHSEELLLFKTSISFVDHLQEFLGAILTACTLVIPPYKDLKENVFSVIDFLQVCLHIVVLTVSRTYNSIISLLLLTGNFYCSSRLILLVGLLLFHH